MSNNVRVVRGASAQETAILLLAAAEETEGFDQEDVVFSSYGGFVVPKEVAKAAGLDYEDEGEAQGHVYTDKQVDQAEKAPLEGPLGDLDPVEEAGQVTAKPEPKPETKAPAKRAPAKKAAAKKAPAKKTGGK